MPLTLDVFVNVNTSSADRHVNVTVDHARTKKKWEGRTRKREKIRLGINADLTLDDCWPSIVFTAMTRRRIARAFPPAVS